MDAGSSPKPPAQLINGRMLGMPLNLRHQVIRQGFPGQCSPGLENFMDLIGNVPQLNHPGHGINILACFSHVNLIGCIVNGYIAAASYASNNAANRKKRHKTAQRRRRNPGLSFCVNLSCPARSGIQRLRVARGVSAPHDEVLLFRQKNPKPVAPGRGPQEKPKVVILNAVKNLFFVGSRSLIESSFARPVHFVQGKLRQSSPSYGMDGTGAQPRPQAPGHVLVIPDPDRGSSVFAFSSICEE